MAASSKNRFRKKKSGPRAAAILIVLAVIVAVAGYALFFPSSKIGMAPQKPQSSSVSPTAPGAQIPQKVITSASAIPPAAHKQVDLPPRTKNEAEPPASVSGRPAVLAVIIDDMGSSISEAGSLAAINVPLTFAIIPGLHSDTEVAAYAASKHIETMIHIPMQPKGWPGQRLEKNGLLVSMAAEELQERVTRFVQQFPGAVGANNHMGSEFTEQREKMAVVLQVLKKNNLFFIDSATSSASTGFTVAQQLGMKAGRRHVFLDNEQEQSYIQNQLKQAIKLARKNGSAIAICHPHPTTIKTLALSLPALEGQGVTLVPASRLVR